jgi:mRNA interferase RelE/StbE
LDWTIEYAAKAAKQFRRLDRANQRRIQRYISSLLQDATSPTQRGKALTGNLAGLWRYRVGDIRLVCDLQQQRLVVLVVRIGHRSTIYD